MTSAMDIWRRKAAISGLSLTNFESCGEMSSVVRLGSPVCYLKVESVSLSGGGRAGARQANRFMVAAADLQKDRHVCK